MLYLYNGPTEVTLSNLYATCNNILNPYFTWRVVNRDTEVETIFYQDDSSNAPYYYNSFTLSVATYSGLTAGIVNLDGGQYDFYIYESDTPYNLVVTTESNLLKNGILNVVPIYSTQSTFTQSMVNTIPTFLGGI